MSEISKELIRLDNGRIDEAFKKIFGDIPVIDSKSEYIRLSKEINSQIAKATRLPKELLSNGSKD